MLFPVFNCSQGVHTNVIRYRNVSSRNKRIHFSNTPSHHLQKDKTTLIVNNTIDEKTKMDGCNTE